MAKLYIQPPSIEYMLSNMIEWLARHMNAKVTITVEKKSGVHFTQEYDGRE